MCDAHGGIGSMSNVDFGPFGLIIPVRACAGAFGEGGAFAMRTPAEQARTAAAADDGREVGPRVAGSAAGC